MKHYYVITTYKTGWVKTRNQRKALAWLNKIGVPPSSIKTYRVIGGKLRCFSGLLTAKQAEKEHLSKVDYYANRGIDIA